MYLHLLYASYVHTCIYVRMIHPILELFSTVDTVGVRLKCHEFNPEVVRLVHKKRGGRKGGRDGVHVPQKLRHHARICIHTQLDNDRLGSWPCLFTTGSFK